MNATPATTAAAAAARTSMELTLETALAFVDSCYNEIDEEDECSDSSSSAAVPTSLAHTTRKRVKCTSSTSDSIPRRHGPPSPGFFETIDRLDQESDVDSLLSIDDALLLLDAYDSSCSSENHSSQTVAAASASSDASVVTEASNFAVSGRRPKRQGTTTARSRTSNSTAIAQAKKATKKAGKSTSAATASATQQPPVATARDSSKATSEAGESSDQSTQKPTKKRVRKQRQELLYLRVKVVEMQQMLNELQRDGSGNGSASEASSSSSTSSAVSSPVATPVPDADPSSRQRQRLELAESSSSATTHIGWASLAELQMQERERAEQENRQLKATLEGQLQLTRSLERLLIGQHDIEIPGLPSTSKRLKASASNVSESEQALLRELKHELKDAYSRFEQELARSYLRDLTTDGGDIQVRNCVDKGMHVEFTASKVVRHRFDVTKQSMWRFMSKDGIRRRSYYYRELEAPRSDYVARSFGFNIATKSKRMDIYGTQVLEKVELDDRVVLLWSAAVQPVRRTDASSSGIRFRERGWVELQSAPASDSHATLVKTFVTFTPDLDASASTMAVGAITDLVVDSVEGNVHFGQAIVDQLVFDEDARVNNIAVVV